MAILDKSTRRLGELKDKIEPLVEFFTAMLEEIRQNVEGGLGDFLRPIENGITVGKTLEEVEAINMSQKSKKVSFHNALGDCQHPFLTTLCLENDGSSNADAGTLLGDQRHLHGVHHRLQRLHSTGYQRNGEPLDDD